MLEDLRIVDFRLIVQLNLELDPHGALFFGDNAQGKTTILEAVCVLLRMQSPRATQLSQLARFDGEKKSSQFGIASKVDGKLRQFRWQRGGTDLSVDGESRTSQRDYLSDSGLVVWMGNEDLDLIRGSGEPRRRYLDFLGSQIDPEYRQALARYKRALKARNQLLKTDSRDEKHIAAYTSLLVQHGAKIMQTREKVVPLLDKLTVENHHKICAQENESPQVEYFPSVKTSLQEAYEQSFDRERRIGQTMVGPHRDDISLSINGLSANEFASEGQQRTLALSLKLAQGALLQSERGAVPVYLLDDIFGELDTKRRNALLGALPADAQKLITTTSDAWIRQTTLTELRQFTVSKGTASLLA